MSLQIASPFQQFFDRDGSPLDNGFIYVGTANLNPETNPLTVYFDDALTIPAAQPLRTSNGYIVRNGSPARLYTSQEDFSLTVRDKSNVLVFTVADATSLSNLQTQLASSSGSSLVGYNQGGTGAVTRTVQARLRDYVSVKDFGAVGNGVTDDTAAIQAAIDSGANLLWYPDGTYLVDGLELASFQSHLSSEGGARINTSGTAYTWTGTTQYVTFDGLSFGGTGKAIYNSDPSYYATAWKIKNCQFGNTLEESFYGTTLLSLFENNLFGANYGSLGAQNRHIYMRGTVGGGLAINQNIIRNNRFFRAAGTGTSAVFIEFGNGNEISRNTFEECSVTPLILDRAGLTDLRGNWFEGNNVASQIVCQNTVAGANFYRNHVSANDNSFLLLNAACVRVFDLDANSEVVSIRDNNFLTVGATPAISRRSSVNNAGIRDWATNTFDPTSGTWLNEKANLVSNGDATSGTTGWTPVDATLAAIVGGGPTGGNYFELTRTGGSSQRFEQTVTGLTVGKLYTVSFFIKSGTSGNEAFLIELIGDYTRNVSGSSTASWVKQTFQYVALDTFAVFRLYKNTATAGTMLFGNIVLQEVIS
jgi:hypothetical protein